MAFRNNNSKLVSQNDVAINNVADNDVLTYNAATQKWGNKTQSTGSAGGTSTLEVPTISTSPTTIVLWDGTNGGVSDSQGRQQINPSQWSYDLGAFETPIGSYNRWGNWEAQIYTSALKNVFVKNGQLHIKGFKENPQISSPTPGEGNADYSSGRIHSQGKLFVPVGAYVEARLMCPSTPGTWPAFWMMGQNYTRDTTTNSSNWPYCGEIDTFEGFSQHTNRAGFALHMTAQGVANDTNAYTSDMYVGWDNSNSLLIDPTLDITHFNYFGLWNSGTEIRRYVNRKETFRYTQAQAMATGRAWPFNQPMFMIVNLALGGQSTDGAAPTYVDRGMGAEMVVDPIKIWNNVSDPAALGLQ